jgi:hypothetical protein
MKNNPKRSIIIKYKNGNTKELELSKATLIKTNDQFIRLDQLKDGKWRLIWSEGLIKDFTQVECFNIIRKDDTATNLE